MTTDLDTTIATALRDAASTTTVSGDALATILRRAERRNRPPRSRRRLAIAGVTVVGVAAGAGATYAAVADRLSPEQTDTIEWIPTCGLDGETARLVATTSGLGRTVEYWTVDAADSSGDLLFEHGGTGGGGGCGPGSRVDTHPHLPWANYLLTDDGNGTAEFWFHGQAPAGTTTVDIVTAAGTTRADVASPDGYFVVLAELPFPDGDQFQRIDAYTADGTLLGSGGLG